MLDIEIFKNINPLRQWRPRRQASVRTHHWPGRGGGRAPAPPLAPAARPTSNHTLQPGPGAGILASDTWSLIVFDPLTRAVLKGHSKHGTVIHVPSVFMFSSVHVSNLMSNQVLPCCQLQVSTGHQSAGHCVPVLVAMLAAAPRVLGEPLLGAEVSRHLDTEVSC